MAYQVTAPLVLAKDQEGHIHHRYEGEVIHWLSDEQAQHFLAEKLVEESSDDIEAEDGPPAKAASKADWVAWAVVKSAETDEPLTAEDADAYSKADLIELFG